MRLFVSIFIGAMIMTAAADPGSAASVSKATFAGGCFWCMESAFEGLPGVSRVVSGYMGGTGKNPTYGDYAEKGHIEVIQIDFDASQTSYEKLLDVFWRQIDPTDGGGQFADRGPQYRTAIFYHDAEQKRLAEASKKKMDASGVFPGPIVTELIPASAFYEAENYHQDYYKTHPFRYKFYRAGSGRDGYLHKIWGKESKSHGESAS